MKKGYLLADSLIALFSIIILSGVIFNTYKSEMKLMELKKIIIEEIRLEKETILSGVNKCVVKDISQAN